MAVRKLPAFHQAVSVARGPIRFVYAPKTVAHDDVLSAGMDFAVALVGAEEIRVIERMDGSVALSARVTPLPRWGMRAASCDQPPIVLSDANIALAFDAELVPYAEAVWPFCPCFKGNARSARFSSSFPSVHIAATAFG